MKDAATVPRPMRTKRASGDSMTILVEGDVEYFVRLAFPLFFKQEKHLDLLCSTGTMTMAVMEISNMAAIVKMLSL